MKNKITIFFLLFYLSALFAQNGIQINTAEAENG